MASSAVPFDLAATRRSLPEALLEIRRSLGAGHVAVIDNDDSVLTAGTLIQGAFALGHALRKHVRVGNAVGMMLPTSGACLVSLLACHVAGIVPAMINHTLGGAGVLAACQAAGLKAIICSRHFVERAHIQPLLTMLSRTLPVHYLEDLQGSFSLLDRAAGCVGVRLRQISGTPWPEPDATAVILFTSGTEGAPKGVALSHANLLANAGQIRAHLDIYPDTDVVMNALPMFHCYGLTVGVLVPLLSGARTVLHPSPLQGREIDRRIRHHRATILLATDTFAASYARQAAPDDLGSLRLVVCGAERLRDETRALLKAKCNASVVEGYGVTEASAVIASNTPGDNQPGSVGRCLTAIEARIEPMNGMTDAGRLLVRGPNVMRGYMRDGLLLPLADGWHDTGDIVSLVDGRLHIRGRARRFAKLGGEMVSLDMVEHAAATLWPGHAHAAIIVEGAARAEEIVLVTDCASAGREDMILWLRSCGLSPLFAPRRICQVASVPVLASGKPDYVAAGRIAGTAASRA
jgi:acyl-[acyl-carrier-protein]-phospholipid O-acyltransferase/long-chain-fatty-acid--[acyl-carrier-protein] ligase